MIGVYLLALSVALLIALVVFWPSSGAPTTDATRNELNIGFWKTCAPSEAKMFLIIMVCAALGNMVHLLRSFFRYVGNMRLKWNWVPMYIFLPVVAATLGVVFYLVMRGGLLSAKTGLADTNLFGFAAAAALVGMFTEMAVIKLRDVAMAFFAPLESLEGKDRLEPPSGKTKDGSG